MIPSSNHPFEPRDPHSTQDSSESQGIHAYFYCDKFTQPTITPNPVVSHVFNNPTFNFASQISPLSIMEIPKWKVKSY